MTLYAVLLWAMLLASPVQPRTPAPSSFDTPQSFAEELHRVRERIGQSDATNVIASLPRAWVVQTLEGKYEISTAPLRMTGNSIPNAQAWLDNLASEAEQYAHPPHAPGAAGKTLKRILSQPEFEKERPPSEWELLQARIGAWLERVIQRFFDLISRNPGASQGLFWVLVFGAVATIAGLLFQLGKRKAFRLNLENEQRGAASQRTWDRWLADARSAANQGDLRRAIQLAYWGAITKLQASDALPRADVHTPREYLRLIARGDAAHEALRTLTGQSERFWYAGATPTPEDFAGTVKSLEDIGCRLG